MHNPRKESSLISNPTEDSSDTDASITDSLISGNTDSSITDSVMSGNSPQDRIRNNEMKNYSFYFEEYVKKSLFLARFSLFATTLEHRPPENSPPGANIDCVTPDSLRSESSNSDTLRAPPSMTSSAMTGPLVTGSSMSGPSLTESLTAGSLAIERETDCSRLPAHRSILMTSEEEIISTNAARDRRKTLNCHYCNRSFNNEKNLINHTRYVHEYQKLKYNIDGDSTAAGSTAAGSTAAGSTAAGSTAAGSTASGSEAVCLSNARLSGLGTSVKSSSRLPSLRRLFCKPGMTIEKESKAQKEFKCPIEGCTFSSRYTPSVKKHVSGVHEGGRQYSCGRCNYTTISKMDYDKHVQRKHGEVKKHRCPLCDKSFFCQSRLKRHIKSTHELLTEHMCKFCCRGFSLPSQLRRHELKCHLKE